MNRKRIADLLVPIFDVALAVLIIPAAYLMKLARRLGMSRLSYTRRVLKAVGVLPVRDHYYEPFVGNNTLRFPLHVARRLPGIDLDEAGQRVFLETLTFQNEIADWRGPKSSQHDFRLGNGSFESGDAEILYQVVRRLRPSRIIEVGSGQSTLVARLAIKANAAEQADYVCDHTCIEPYEARWLESSGINVVRSKVEEIDLGFFQTLGRNDLLFIDSSHVIRPQGDVVTEYLQILPSLRSGVVVHVHDVFTPRDYPAEWITRSMLLWNEQYLMEGFLTNNSEWRVLCAVNFLKHLDFAALAKSAPYLEQWREPGSMYIYKA